MKFYMLDNNDSFVYNLAAYFRELNQDIIVENIETANITCLGEKGYHGIIISPGPGIPEQAVLSQQLIKKYAGIIPILGVCLGHQVMGYCFGANVGKGNRPMHGKLSGITNHGKRLFENLPQRFQVTRYHSLVIERKTLPKEIVIDAVSDDEEIMAISHAQYPVYGVQFHPEAILSEHGHALIHNYITICETWENIHDSHKKM